MTVTEADVDPVTLEIVGSRMDEIVRQMQYAMYRTGYSTIIRESKDTSAGITTKDGRLIGQETQHPFHFGIFVPTIEAIFEYFDEEEINPGDAFTMNDPYIGGSPHSPDFVVASPAFVDGTIVGWCINIAHKPDIGGLVPGTSSGSARELYHEGIQLPPVKLYSAGEPNEDVLNIIQNNSRIPETTVGDLEGQVGCTRIGVKEVTDLIKEHGIKTVNACFDELIHSTAQRVQNHVSEWPDDIYEAEGFLDNDGATDDPVRIHVRIEKAGDDLRFDFTSSDDQTIGPVNIQPTLVRSACYYGLIAMTDNTIPSNFGLTKTCNIDLREGSVLSPRRPAPVNHYSYTLFVLIETILRALSHFNPDRATAGGGGKTAISVGGTYERPTENGPETESFVQYEILGSGYGGTRRTDGASCIDIHGTNCEITPIEIIETEFPSRVTRFDVATNSAGAGEHRGGVGYYRDYRFLDDIEFTYRGACHRFGGQGVLGGADASLASAVVQQNGDQRDLPTMTENVALKAGDEVLLTRPGGAGCGNPLERPPDAVVSDVQNGYVSADGAREEYGVVVIDGELDQVATEQLRAERRDD